MIQAALFAAPASPRRSPSTAWVDALHADLARISALTLADLKPAQRLTLGRVHALRFGNCTKNERTNKSRGMNVAVGLAKMGSSVLYETLTVSRYLRLCEKVHALRDGAPWFDVFLLRLLAQ